MKTNTILAILGIIVMGVSIAGSETLTPVGLQKQLLVDDYVIAEKQNITRVLGKPKKLGIVLKPTLDTEFHPKWGKPNGSKVAMDFGFYLSAGYNDKARKFQMWYMAYRNSGVGYAESKNGVTWTKPKVGEGRKSNIVHPSQGFSCTLDPTLPWGHPEKYKAAYDPGNVKCAIGYSADGVDWKAYNNGGSITHRAADTHNQLLWDPIAKRYTILTRTDVGGHGGADEIRSTRIMVHTKDNDLINQPTAWNTIADQIKVDDPKDEKNKWGKPRLQFNGMTMWTHEGVYFGLMDVYTSDQAKFFDGFDYKTRHDEDYMDFYIGTSRDAVNFDKSWVHARKPFVPRGKDGKFDKDGVKPPSQIITVKDEHWIYYSGMSERHYSRGRHLNIGLAKLPLDRFIGQAAGSKAGLIDTKPFKLEGNKLEVNVDAKRGKIRIELLDEEGEAILGFIATFKSVDKIRLSPRWRLSKLKGKTVKLRFRLMNATLYAFDFNK